MLTYPACPEGNCLSTHAALITSDRGGGSGEFYQQYVNFVELKKSNFDERYSPSDDSKLVTHAC